MRLKTALKLIFDCLIIKEKPRLNNKQNKELKILLEKSLKKPTNVLKIDCFTINIEGKTYWIGNRFFSYGNLWSTIKEITGQPNLWNKYLLYRLELRTQKFKERIVRRF